MTVVIGLHGKKKAGKTTFEGVARKIIPFHQLECLAFADALKECCKLLACRNKDCFYSQQGKETVLTNVQVNLTEVCFDIVSFGFTYENCKQLNLNPINCMLVLQQAIRQTFKVKDMANGMFQNVDFGGITAGRLLQIMGGDICRNRIHPQLWVNLIKNKILSLKGKRDVILVTDVREENEYEMLSSLDMETHIISIQRPLYLSTEEGEVRRGGDRLENHSSETALDNVEFNCTIVNNGSLEDFQEVVEMILIKMLL